MEQVHSQQLAPARVAQQQRPLRWAVTDLQHRVVHQVTVTQQGFCLQACRRPEV